MKEAPKNRTKLQSAMEYLTTYGWTLLVLALILASMFVLGLFNSNNYTPTAKPGACYVLKNECTETHLPRVRVRAHYQSL